MTKRPKILLVLRSFVLRAEDGKMVIVRRAKTKAHSPGLWEVPGGKLDERETFVQAREREIMEETGLLTKSSSSLVSSHSYVITDGPYKGLLHVALFGVARLVGGTLKLSAEHDDSAWVTYEEMLSYDLTPGVRDAALILKEFLT